MAKTIEFIEDQESAQKAVNALRENERNDLIACRFGEGILKFVVNIFPDADLDMILAKKVEREPEGHGAHFDIYGERLDPDFPYVGVFNLSGEVNIEATELPKDMQESYFKHFRETDETAATARRSFGALALSAAGDNLTYGKLKPGNGFILPQHPEGPFVVHNVMPVDKQNPGALMKFIIPNIHVPKVKDEREVLSRAGYNALDTVVTEFVGGSVQSLPDISEEEPEISGQALVKRSPRRRRGIYDAVRPRMD